MPVRSGYMTSRGAEPGSWIRTNTRDRQWWKLDPEFANGNYQMTMTWHHNIPDNKWRDFWNILLVNGWLQEMQEFLYLAGMDDRPNSDVRISTYISKFDYLAKEFRRLEKVNGAPQGEAKELFQRDSTTLTESWAVNDANKFLTANEYDALSTFVSWQAWNIVEGPLNTLRTGDPGDEFDDFSGLIPRQRSTLIKSLLAAVQAQINTPGTKYKNLLDTLKACRPLRNMRVIPFSLAIWEKDANSKGTISKVSINGIPRDKWRLKQAA
jgi:hypothetical protein